jgi:hypothetical protein
MEDLEQPVFEEREDHTIVRLKYPRLEIKVLDMDCTPKQLERALRSAYEWLKHGKGDYKIQQD